MENKNLEHSGEVLVKSAEAIDKSVKPKRLAFKKKVYELDLHPSDWSKIEKLHNLYIKDGNSAVNSVIELRNMLRYFRERFSGNLDIDVNKSKVDTMNRLIENLRQTGNEAPLRLVGVRLKAKVELQDETAKLSRTKKLQQHNAAKKKQIAKNKAALAALTQEK